MAWKRYPVASQISDEEVRVIAEECSTYPFLIRALLARDYEQEDIKKMFLTPAELIPNQPLIHSVAAADTIIKHLQNNSNIYVFADYDVDGMSSGYVMGQGLRSIRNAIGSQSKIKVYYPEREEGYGLSMYFAEMAIEQNTHLVITVDNGISKGAEVEFLKENNVDVIITDHHLMEQESTVPDALIVDPAYNEESRSYLAGVGVAWHVLRTIVARANVNLDVNFFLDAVAIGTICDMMPLEPENMALVRFGLQIVNSNMPGNAFLKWYKQYKHPITGVSVKDFGWDIGPALNAAGRMGNTKLGASSFYLNNEEAMRETFKEIESLNNKRKKITKELSSEVSKIDFGKDKFIAYDGSKTEAGVHGIIAGELTKYNPQLPCFVYNVDKETGMATGSVRCQSDIPLWDMLQKQKENGLIEKVAGHDHACVISAPADKLKDFVDSFTQDFNKMDLDDDDEDDEFYDEIISMKDVNIQTLNAINTLPLTDSVKPVFYMHDIVISSVKPTKDGKKAFVQMSDNTASKRVFMFGYPDYLAMGSPARVDILCQIEQDFTSTRPSATISICEMRTVE